MEKLLEKEDTTTKCLCENSNLKLFLQTDNYIIYGEPRENLNIILKYTGKLIQTVNSTTSEKCIYLNYGYGNNWNRKTCVKMDKCSVSDDDYYCKTIPILETETLYFCFMDNNNNWDLENNLSSYSIQVLEKEDIVTKSNNAELYLVNTEYESKVHIILEKLKVAVLGLFKFLGKAFDKL